MILPLVSSMADALPSAKIWVWSGDTLSTVREAGTEYVFWKDL